MMITIIGHMYLMQSLFMFTTQIIYTSKCRQLLFIFYFYLTLKWMFVLFTQHGKF